MCALLAVLRATFYNSNIVFVFITVSDFVSVLQLLKFLLMFHLLNALLKTDCVKKQSSPHIYPEQTIKMYSMRVCLSY